MMKRLAAFLSLWVILLGISVPAFGQTYVPPPAATQGQGGWMDWATGHGGFGTPDAACRDQSASFNWGGVYDGAALQDLTHAGCQWHYVTGSGPLPVGVELICPSGSFATVQEGCARRVDVVPVCIPCLMAQAAGPNLTVGHPISLATGTESESETDYASGDGLLAIKRSFSSIQRGRPYEADHELPGFGKVWHGLIPGRLVMSGSTNEENAEFESDNGGIDFYLAPASDTSSYVYVEQGVNRGTLSAVGTPSANRVSYFQTGASVANGAAEMRLDFGNGETIFFRRADTFRLSTDIRYLVPIEHDFPSGYKQYFDYPDTGEYPSRIRDSFGRQIAITWTALSTGNQITYKVISRLDLPDGTAMTYQYAQPQPPAINRSYYTGSPQDVLVTSKHIDATSALLWSHGYLYEDGRFPYALTGILDQNSQRLHTFAYSDAGMAVSTQQAGGFQNYTVAYLQDDPSVRLQHYIRTVTGPLGQVETYTYLRDEGAPAGMQPTLMQIDRAASPTVPAASQTFSYTNTNGTDFMMSGTQDLRGTTSASTLDTVNRRPTAITEAQGTSVARTINTTWHTQFDLPTHVVKQGLTTDYTYTATGQILTQTDTDTTSQTVPYSTAGQTRKTTYTWDANGRLLTINGPRPVDGGGHDDTVTFVYDASGNRSTMTDGLGHVTHYAAYDANGRPGNMTDMNGIVTQFTYDGLGRVKTITVKHPTTASLDAVTTIYYDVEGRVTGITRPATEELFFDYNLAGLMTSMRAANGERTDYTYDAMGDVTSETVKRTDATAARTTTRTFDSLGRMLTEALGPSRVTRWAYDANGNPTTVTNPMSNATTQAFDALDRLTTTVASAAGTTTLAYDQKDNLTQNTDPKSVVTNFVRDGFGEVIQEASPDRGTSIYHYDAGGTMTSSQDARGQVVTYTYDILGRLTQKVPTGHTTDTVTYTWDTGGLTGSYGVGRLNKIVDASGTTQFSYDHRGNILIQQQAIGTSTAAQLVYAYDLGDHITQITYPSGRIVQYGRDTKGRVNLIQTKASASVTSWTSIASGFTYEPFAALKTVALGNTLSVANDWGNDGRLASRRLYKTSGGTNLSYLAYGYDQDDNVTSIMDQMNDANSIYYGYDQADRLNKSALTTGTVTAGTDTYSYTTGTNRLASIANSSGTRSLTYDGRGNLATESRPGSISATTGYDGYARLTSYVRTDVGTYTFVYNGRDDRVAMTRSTGTRRFLYDPDGRVLAEYGASATDVKAEYIWTLPALANDNDLFGGDDGAGGYMPMAVATPNSGGTIVINWVHGNHLGVPLVTTDSTGVAATTPNDYFQPGYPGQSRVIADLYYNRYRDYDPTTGRYVEADPIGLRGGQNDYAYAANNPIKLTDPKGLATAWWGYAGGAAAEIIGLGPEDPAANALAAAIFLAAHQPDCPAMLMARPTKPTKKQKSTDYPSWANQYEKDPGDSCQKFATDVMNDKYGVGNWADKFGEYSKLVKACQRGTRWK